MSSGDNKNRDWAVYLWAVAAALMVPNHAASSDRRNAPIAYPEGFRAWTHISSSTVGPANPAAPKYQGIHHIYANEKALAGYKAGAFPDGSVIVFDLWATTINPDDSVAATNRKFIDVMVKDKARFAATDGWGYAEFMTPGRRRVDVVESNPMKSCHSCHKTKAASDFVFSKLPDDL